MTITKEQLEQGYRTEKVGISNKWAIKTHLQEDPRHYTPEAREYLIAIAREKGFKDEEIQEILVSAEKQRKRLNTGGELFLQIASVFVVIAASIAIMPLFEFSKFAGISASILLIVGVVRVMWKRGW